MAQVVTNLGDLWWIVTDQKIPPGIPSTGFTSDNQIPEEVYKQFGYGPYTIQTFTNEADRKRFIEHLYPPTKTPPTTPPTTPLPSPAKWHFPDLAPSAWALISALGIAGIFGLSYLLRKRG